VVASGDFGDLNFSFLVSSGKLMMGRHRFRRMFVKEVIFGAPLHHWLFAVCKKRQGLANWRVAHFGRLLKNSFHNGRGMQRRNRSIRGEQRTMKKILILATVFGLAAVVTASAGDAKETWDKTCAKCHGTDGKGQTKMGQKLGVRDYSDPKVQADLKDDAAFKAIKEGLKDKDDKTLMKPVEGLSDDEIKALVAQVRSFKQ
jgi:cytochrome c553